MQIVDASVIVKLLFTEAGSDRAKELILTNNNLAVPDILFVEVANSLATKTIVTSEQIQQGMEFVFQLGLQVMDIDKQSLILAAKLAKQTGTAVYDMIYAVLAQNLKVELVTADANFARKTGFDFVKVLEV